MCMSLLLHECMCTTSCLELTQESEEGIRSPGTGVTDHCEIQVGADN